MSKIKTCFLFLASIFIFCGCADSGDDSRVDQIKIISGNNQCAAHDELCQKTLVIELLGPPKKGFLGSGGARSPIEGVSVSFSTQDSSGTGPKVECANPLSDHGGVVRCKIRAGKKTGDSYILIEADGHPKAKAMARVVSGVSISGDRQQGRTGQTLSEPFRLKIQDNSSSPISGVPVYFQIVSAPEEKSKASCSPSNLLSDGDGEASSKFKLGNATGTYRVMAELSDPERGLHVRGIEFCGMGLNIWKLVFVVAGGLAIFIFGMKMMSDGLQIVAGDRMREILRFFTSNSLSAVLAGAVVTGIVQSSSATTVMIVGFTNAGIMSLRQAIGVIFGANIGTTVTAQIISFKINDLAFPAIIAGVIVLLLAKKSNLKGWGQAVLGFGMLFFGMIIMGDELKKIADFPEFVNFFRTFDCEPVNGRMPIGAIIGAIGIGTAMTVLIQSSSATIGIALALASSGLLNFWTAVPLILGDNIGTTITAVLASIGTNEKARQTALSHVMFNVLGVMYMFILFFIPFPGTDIPIFMYLVDAITPGEVFGEIPQNIERHIAVAHSMFNVCNVLLFLPFIGYFEIVCNKIIRVKDESLVRTTVLEPHLLDSPPAAIEQVTVEVSLMLDEAFSMLRKVMDEFFFAGHFNEETAREIEKTESRIDQMQEDSMEYLVRLTSRPLTVEQAELIPLLMDCVNDAESVADHSLVVMELSRRMSLAKNKLSGDALAELGNVWETLKCQAKFTLEYFRSTDLNSVLKAMEDERKINELYKEYEGNHILRMKKGKCKVKAGIIFIEMLSELENIGDHLDKIAKTTPKIVMHRMAVAAPPHA